MSKQAVANYDHKFFLNGQGISGIQDINMSYSVSEKPVNILGVGFARSIYNAPLQGTVSLSRDILYQDPILHYSL